MSREQEILIDRATPLVVGVVGHVEGPAGERLVRVGGSGIFIAPFQALTAKHVTRDLFRTNPDRGDDVRRRVTAAEEYGRTDYFELPHSAVLYQPKFERAGRFDRIRRSLFWQVRRVWDSPITDISLMEVHAEGDEAGGMEREMTGFFEWALLPPPVGSHVITLGYPLADATSQDGLMNINTMYVLQEGRVTEVQERRRERGFLSFPGFRIDQSVNHGFSGGPVFWEGRLCGIVSGDCEGGTYVASLWPLCLLEYEYRDMGTLGPKEEFRNLFERGVLRSEDWPRIRDRITKEYDENDRPYAHIAPAGEG